jgi:hypothetical protein
MAIPAHGVDAGYNRHPNRGPPTKGPSATTADDAEPFRRMWIPYDFLMLHGGDRYDAIEDTEENNPTKV